MRTIATLSRRIVATVGFVAVVGAMGGGCSSQTSKGQLSASVTAQSSNKSAEPAKSAKPQTMPLADFCKQLHAKLDALVVACHAKPETEDLFKILKMSADDMLEEDNSCARLKNVEVLAEKAPACLAEVQTHWSGALVHIEHTPACRAAFVGKTPSGGKCGSDLECVAGSFCVADPESPDPLASVCSPPMAAGVKCIEHRGEACGPDLECSNGKCVPRPIAGEACLASAQNCAPGLACLIETSTAKEGKCAPRRKAGEACHRWTECEGACVAPKDKKDGTCESFCGSR